MLLKNCRPKWKTHTQERQLTRFFCILQLIYKENRTDGFSKPNQNRTKLEKSIPHVANDKRNYRVVHKVLRQQLINWLKTFSGLKSSVISNLLRGGAIWNPSRTPTSPDCGTRAWRHVCDRQSTWHTSPCPTQTASQCQSNPPAAASSRPTHSGQ